MAVNVEQQLYVNANESDLRSLSQEVGGLVTATYSFPANDEVKAKQMALQIASGQTLGYVPPSIAAYSQYIARILSVEISVGRGRAKIVFPAHLFGTDVAGLLTILFGKISFAPGLCLEAIEGDERFLQRLAGPRIGLAGIREKVGVQSQQPLLMAILKPGIGPNDRALAEQFAMLTDAGTHLIKDDEVRVDVSLDDALHRLKTVLEMSGGRGMYVMALNGPAFALRERALRLQSAGAQAFLVCPYTYGVSVIQSLCEDPEIKVPVFAHPAFTGVMHHQNQGIAPAVSMGTLMRWAGADAVLFPSPYGTIALPKDDAVAIHNELIKTSQHLKVVASVPSAGIVPEFVSQIRQDFGYDVVVNAGTGMARGGGSIADGAKAFLSAMNRHFGDQL